MKFFDNLWVRQPPEIPPSPQVPTAQNTLPTTKSIAQRHSNRDTITTIGITATGILLGLGGSYLVLQHYTPKPIPPVTTYPEFTGITTKALTFLGVSTLLYYLARPGSATESKKSLPHKPQNVSVVPTSIQPEKRTADVTQHSDVDDSAPQPQAIKPTKPKETTNKIPDATRPLLRATRGKYKKPIANEIVSEINETEEIKKLKEKILNHITKKDKIGLSAFIRMIASSDNQNAKRFFCEALIQLLTEYSKTGEVYSTAGDYLYYYNEKLKKTNNSLNFDIHHINLLRTLTNCIKDQFRSENVNIQNDFGNPIYGAFQVLLQYIDDDAALKIARTCLRFHYDKKYLNLIEIVEMHDSFKEKSRNNLEILSSTFIKKFLKLKKQKLIIDCMDKTKHCEDASDKYNEWNPKDFLCKCEKPVLMAFLKACARLNCEKYKKFQMTIVDELCNIFINEKCSNNSFTGDQKIATAKQILDVFLEVKNYEMIYGLVNKLSGYFTFKILFNYLKKILNDDSHELLQRFQHLENEEKRLTDQVNSCLNYFKELIINKQYENAARILKIFQNTKSVGPALLKLKEEILPKNSEAEEKFDKEFIRLEYVIISPENTSNVNSFEIVYQAIEHVKNTALNYQWK